MNWPNRADQLRLLMPLLRGRSPVLDLGCGDGILLSLLKEAGETGTGVDLDPAAVDAGRARGFDITRSDVLDFMGGAGAGMYGAVVASHVLEHLPPSRVPGILADCARILRPGGLLVLLTPNPRNIGVITRTFWGDLGHVRPYSLDLVVRLVGEAGLSVVSAGDDPYTRQPGFRRALNLLRRLIVGDYWPGADLKVVAEKTSPSR